MVMPEPIEVFTDRILNPTKSGEAITTIGTFDGVHLGHQEILHRLAANGGEKRVRTVVTFEPHPQNIMRKRHGLLPTISNPEEKIRLLKLGGVDRVLILRFTDQLANVSAERFLEAILLKKLNSTKLIIGYNHSFGKNREGTREFLEKVQPKYGFELEVVGPHYIQGETVSSTKIRRALGEGDITKANTLLGRPYFLTGTVVPGRAMGRKLSFPTANIQLTYEGKLIPKFGVYTVAVGIANEVYPGMLNIGTRPTFGEGNVTIEVHLINFEGDIYDKSINLIFLERLRGEQRFETPEDLIEQIKKDQIESERIYSTLSVDKLAQELTL